MAPGAADKTHVASYLTDPPTHPFDLKSDVPAMFDKESHLHLCLERLSASSMGTSDLFPRIVASRVCTTEVSSQDGLSNLSMLGHNSTTVTPRVSNPHD
jgi:hypothetical protein